MKIKIWSVLFILILFTACAPTKKIRNWISSPSVQKGGNESFGVRFEPLKGDKKFFVSFRLSVMNKTDKSLKIDWNKTRYIYKGKPYGGFVFYGINPADIKNSIPPDLIAPGKLFSKEIFPTYKELHPTRSHCPRKTIFKRDLSYQLSCVYPHKRRSA
ncbi:MAG: hypothetical protein JRJ15_16565 [Deltaproteobacteria bacterium]|nr:hypothetical protein [Deltaproteobacteria bacterium]